MKKILTKFLYKIIKKFGLFKLHPVLSHIDSRVKFYQGVLQNNVFDSYSEYTSGPIGWREYAECSPDAISIIHKMFRKTKVSSKKIEDEWWDDIFMLSMLNDEDFLNFNIGVMQKTRKLNFLSLSTYEWLEIYRFVLLLSLYDIGLILRGFAVNAAIYGLNPQAHKMTKKRLRLGLAGLIDTGEWKKAQKLIVQYGVRYNKLEAFRLADEFLCAVNKESECFKNIDFKYKNLVKDKTIAIVGPVEDVSHDKSEIDTFDIKVGFSIMTDQNNILRAERYHNYDVSYYSKRIAWYIMQKTNLYSIAHFLKFAVFRGRLKSSRDMLLKDTGINGRSMTEYKSILLNGSFNLVPNALMDVLKYGPRKVKLFNLDLFSSNKYIMSYHPAGVTTDSIAKLAIGHDLITQFNLLYNCWNNNLFEADEVLDNILSNGVDHYVHVLQLRFKS